MVSAAEAERTIARCAQAESAQHPLVRLANVAMQRRSDGKPLDIEMLTAYLAGRAKLDYLRIDPLKVDVGTRILARDPFRLAGGKRNLAIDRQRQFEGDARAAKRETG